MYVSDNKVASLSAVCHFLKLLLLHSYYLYPEILWVVSIAAEECELWCCYARSHSSSQREFTKICTLVLNIKERRIRLDCSYKIVRTPLPLLIYISICMTFVCIFFRVVAQCLRWRDGWRRDLRYTQLWLIDLLMHPYNLFPRSVRPLHFLIINF